MRSEFVSVIIPAWKAAGTIGHALDSLRGQTRPPDEVIVVDDGSPDDIASAVRPYGDWVRYIRKTNGGAASARNIGMDVAKGDFVAFLDADDYWSPEKLERQMAVFAKHPDVGLVSSRYVITEAGCAPIVFPPLADAVWDKTWRAAGSDAFEAAMIVWTSAMIVRREVLGSERFDEGLKVAEDRDLWVRLVCKSPVYLQSDVLATLVATQGSLSRSDVDLDCRSMLTMIHRHRGLLDARSLHRWEVDVYRRWAGTHLSLGQMGKAFVPAIRRLVYEPLSPEGWWVLGKTTLLWLAPRKWSSQVLQPEQSA